MAARVILAAGGAKVGTGGDAAAAKTSTGAAGAWVSAKIAGAGGVGIGGNGASGKADAQSTAANGDGSVTTIAHAPSAIAASAVAGTNTSGAGSLIAITPGQAASNAAGNLVSGSVVGAMSAGYGGSGEPLTYTAEADFTFAPTAPERFFLTLLDNNSAAAGFDSLTFEVTLNGAPVVSESTNNLAAAEAFFTDNTFDLGSLVAGPQTFEFTYTLVASPVGDGFGFTYDTTIPEASTWAMMLMGLVGLGYAALRRAAKERSASDQPLG